MVDRLKGKWKSDRAEGMNEYMIATNVGLAVRLIAPKMPVNEEISQNGDEWTIHLTSTFKNHKMVFKIGEPFTDNTLDGKTMKTTFTIEGNTLVTQQEALKEKEVPTKYTREVLDNGEMLLTCEAANGVICKRWLKPHNP